MSTEAEIQVSLDGGDSVKRALPASALQKVSGETDKASESGKKLGDGAKKASTFWKDAGKDIVSSLNTMATAAIGTVTALQTISFSQAITQAKALDDTFARFSAGSGRSVGDLRSQVRGLSLATNTQEKDVLAWSKAIGRVTYDSKGAMDAYKSFFNEAVATNQDVGEQGGVAQLLLGDLQLSGGQADEFLKKLHGMSEAAGNVGGFAALKDSLTEIGSGMSDFSFKATDAKDQLAAFILTVGKGQTAAHGKQAASAIIGSLQGNAEGLARQFGAANVYDEDGRFKTENVPLFMKKIKEDLTKRYGASARKVAMQGNNFGAVGGAALWNFDEDAYRKSINAGGSDAAGKAASGYLNSDEGKRANNDLKRQQSMEDNARKLLPAQDFFGQLAADHPILAPLAALTGGTLAKTGLKAGVKALFGGGEAAAGGTAAEGTALTAGGGMGLLGGALTAGGGVLASLGALTAATAPLNANMPQIQAETQGQLDTQREGRARAIVQAVATGGGGGVEGVESALGPATLGAVKSDPVLSSLLEQFENQAEVIKGLPDNIAKATADALKGSPLTVQVLNNTGGPIQGAADVQSNNSRQ